MKTNNIFRLLAASVAIAFTAVACGPQVEPEEEKKPAPTFPALVENNNVQPGEELTLTFTPNYDWAVTIPDESLQWFPLMDGSFRYSRLSGKASETPVTVTIQVSNTEEFATNRSVEVSLTMDGQTKVIAKYMRPAKEPVINVYSVLAENDEFLFANDGSGKYAYSESEAEEINLIWPFGTNGFRTSVKVVSNCEWVISLPEWAEAEVPEKSTGETTFNILGEPSKYPLEGAEGKLQFKFNDEVVKELKITIPPCNDKISLTLANALTGLVFNANGRYQLPSMYAEAPAIAILDATDEAKVYAVEWDGEKYASEASWVSLDVEDWDTSANAYVIQERNVNVTVADNTGAERSAIVVGVPASVSIGSVSELFTADGTELLEEYKVNSFHLVQKAVDEEYMIPASTKDEMDAVGVYFSVISDDMLTSKFATENVYDLIHSTTWAEDAGSFYFNEPFDTFAVYDEKLTEVNPVDSWLGFTAPTDNTYGTITMNTKASYDNEGNNTGNAKENGYIVFKKNGSAVAVVKCMFDEDYVPGDSGDDTTSDYGFIGENAMSADMVGASMVEITSGDLYDGWKEYGCPIYQLTYKMEGMPMTISIPKTSKIYSVNPYNNRNYFKVNDLDYDESAGQFEFIDGGVTIYMEMPEGSERISGTILFYNSNNSVVFVLCCTLDLTSEE